MSIKIHSILQTEAGNLTTTVNYIYGDAAELNKEAHDLTQTNPVLIVAPLNVRTQYLQSDLPIDTWTVTFSLLKYMPLDGTQAGRAADMDALHILGQEYIYRVRKNSDIVANTGGRAVIEASGRQLYQYAANGFFGYEYTFDVEYQYNSNISGAS